MFVFSVIFCPVIPPIRFATVSSNETVYGSNVTVKCDVGFELDLNVSSVITTCGETSWLPDVTNASFACKRKINIKYFV